MSRIDGCFARLGEEGRKALIPFVTAGDPTLDSTVPLLHALVSAGADILELGVPFSDPIADGPVIQRASERALAGGASLKGIFEIVRDFRSTDRDTPVVLMGYLNPFEAMGYADFAQAAAGAGVDGVLTVDLPPEEADVFVQAVRGHGIDPIFLVAPNSDDTRIARICKYARGYVYYVSLKGVTGAANLDIPSVAEKVATIKAATNLPVGVGFGIKDAATAARVAAVSDAVVVGSALVTKIEALARNPAQIPEAVAELVRQMRQAMDGRPA